MGNVCCCASSRKPSSAKGKEPEVPAPPPPARLPGTDALAPPVPPFAQPTYSAASVSSRCGLPGPSSRVPDPTSRVPGPSPLVPAPYPYLDPGDLIVEDSESEAELQPASQTNEGSTTSLGQRIRKQFSTDALPRKREPTPIAYTSEELAWRAHLKRSRNERIRQELSPNGNTAHAYPSKGPSKLRLEPNPSIALPGGGPRDYLEFTLETKSQAGNETSAAEGGDQKPEDDMEGPSSIYTHADDQDPSLEESSFHLPRPHASWTNSLALLGPESIYPGNPFSRDSYPPIDEGSPA